LYEYVNGDKLYLLNGKLHREDGAAVEYANGDKQWYLNGKCHRIDGPAVEHVNGYNSWYSNDQFVPCETQEQFERLMKLKAFW